MYSNEKRIKYFKISSILISFILIFSLSEIFVRYKYLGFDGYTFNQDLFKLKIWHKTKFNWQYANRQPHFKKKWPVQKDSDLGWKLLSGDHTNYNPWNTKVNIDSNGFRSNGILKSDDINQKIIVFVGDSYTFGDGVDDQNTFPSLFQKKINKEVVNYGVSGYGIDQMYLKSIDLLKRYDISELFFCFIPDDIIRTHYSIYNGLKKPYFEFENDELKLNKINETFIEKKIQKYDSITDYSLLLYLVKAKLSNEYWYTPTMIGVKSEHKNGVEISIKLINQLKDFCDLKKVKLHVIPLMSHPINQSKLLYPKFDKKIKHVLKEINNDISVINLYRKFDLIKKENPDTFKTFYSDIYFHFNLKGNNFVAESIYSSIIK